MANLLFYFVNDLDFTNNRWFFTQLLISCENHRISRSNVTFDDHIYCAFSDQGIYAIEQVIQIIETNSRTWKFHLLGNKNHLDAQFPGLTSRIQISLKNRSENLEPIQLESTDNFAEQLAKWMTIPEIRIIRL